VISGIAHSIINQNFENYKNDFKPKKAVDLTVLGFSWIGIILKNTGTLPRPLVTVALTGA
jgi:hypothetical protein